MKYVPEIVMSQILDGVTADEDGTTYDTSSIAPIKELCEIANAAYAIIEHEHTDGSKSLVGRQRLRELFKPKGTGLDMHTLERHKRTATAREQNGGGDAK